MQHSLSFIGVRRMALLAVAAGTMVLSLSFAAPRAEAATYQYCVNAFLNYGTSFCAGPRHTLKTNAASAVSPVGATVCENATLKLQDHQTKWVNGWKCASGYVQRTYAAKNIYYPAIAYGPFRPTGGTSPSNARLTGQASY